MACVLLTSLTAHSKSLGRYCKSSLGFGFGLIDFLGIWRSGLAYLLLPGYEHRHLGRLVEVPELQVELEQQVVVLEGLLGAIYQVVHQMPRQLVILSAAHHRNRLHKGLGTFWPVVFYRPLCTTQNLGAAAPPDSPRAVISLVHRGCPHLYTVRGF